MSTFDFATTAELRADGYTVRTIRESIEAGSIERVIKGWYCTHTTPRAAVRAMRLGGRVGCVSALELHGGWCPPDTGLHMLLPSHASGRRLASRGLPERTTVHWHAKDDRVGSAFPVAPVDLAVQHLLECQPAHLTIAVLDSLLHRRIVDATRLRALIAAGPYRARFLSDHLEPRSEEGIESIVRFRLAVAGIRSRVQVAVRSDRVDLLIDDWLVVELDGRTVHAQADSFTRDRVRSARLFRDGRVVLQFAYATVIYDWEFVLQTIRDVRDRWSAPTSATSPRLRSVQAQ